MTIFLKKTFIFLIPIAIIFVFPISIFILGREYYSSENAVRIQMKRSEAIFGVVYTNQNKTYKELLMKKINPLIMVLGTSKAGAFRTDFFEKKNIPENTFGNASNAIISISEMNQFIKALPLESKTKLLILELDQNMFFKDIPELDQSLFFERFKNLLVANWRTPYIDYYHGRFYISELLQQYKETKNIGLNALVNGRGFRSDGSFRDGKKLDEKTLKPQLALDITNEITEIKNDRGSFLYGQKIRQSDLDSLDTLLQLCKERDIYVVGFLPPYPNSLYNEMVEVDDLYKQMVFDLPKQIGNTFSQYDFGFYDFSDIKIIDAPDTEFSDINHGTDKMYLRMTIYMAKKNKKFNAYVDLSVLEKRLEETKEDFLNTQ